jgi:hypothetical protein
VRLALKVVIQNDGDFVEVILLHQQCSVLKTFSVVCRPPLQESCDGFNQQLTNFYCMSEKQYRTFNGVAVPMFAQNSPTFNSVMVWLLSRSPLWPQQHQFKAILSVKRF